MEYRRLANGAALDEYYHSDEFRELMRNPPPAPPIPRRYLWQPGGLLKRQAE